MQNYDELIPRRLNTLPLEAGETVTQVRKQAPHRSHSRGRRVPPHLALFTRQSRGDGRWRPHLTAAERTLIGR